MEQAYGIFEETAYRSAYFFNDDSLSPKSRTTHEKDIPMIKKKKTSSWTWMLLVGVIALLAGAAGGAAATSTTGGGTTPATGDVTVGW